MNIPLGPIPMLLAYLQGNSPYSELDVMMRFFVVLVIALILAPFHECAHALAAKIMGDDTAEREGRLTLNPIVHLDPMGTLMKFFLCFGWAKPVPVNPMRANRKFTMRKFMALTAAAGPASNIILALIFVIIAKIIGLNAGSEVMVYAYFACWMIAQISVVLAVFNMLPIPPLDGSKILYFFLSNHQINMFERNMHIIRMVLLFSMIALPYRYNPIMIIISFATGHIMNGLDAITFFIR
jgi:Zn-dependent protease